MQTLDKLFFRQICTHPNQFGLFHTGPNLRGNAVDDVMHFTYFVNPKNDPDKTLNWGSKVKITLAQMI